MVLEWCFVLMLLFVGVYLTILTRFFSFRHLGRALKEVFRPQTGEKGSVTVFSSLCTTLAATIGTGNIVGVAAAVTTGGPGALFWMLLASLFSMTTKFAENLLAVVYRRRDGQGKNLGGPFGYIQYGLGKRFIWLARLFALACVIAGALGMGTVTQSNSIAGAVKVLFPDFAFTPLVTSVVVTILTALVIFGGVGRIAKVSEAIVPAMSVGYIFLCGIILFRYRQMLPEAVRLVFQCAFSPRAAGGAAAGLTVQKVALLGIQRGIFSNEAGLGTSSIAAASAETEDAVLQGYNGMVSVFIDTIVLCTLTGLTVIITGAAGDSGVQIANDSWGLGLPWNPEISKTILSLFLAIFGFTSILGWNCYVERSVTYLFDSPIITKLYQCVYLLAVFMGPFLSVQFAWRVADYTNALMAIPNLIALYLLRHKILEYTPQKRPGH